MRVSTPVSLPHHVPKTVVLTTMDSNKLSDNSVSLKESYHNGLNVPVTIVLRSGQRIQVPPTRGGSGEFCVVQIQEYQNSVILDNTELSDDSGTKTSKLAEEIIAALGLLQTPSGFGPVMGRRVALKFSLSHQELVSQGGSIYAPSLDIVVSLKGYASAPIHPFSMLGMRKHLTTVDPMFDHSNGLHYQVRIVDRTGQFGTRWINLNGQVFQVPVITDGSYQDGVYVISTHPGESVSPFQYARADYYQFADLTDAILPLYRNAGDAATLGDPQSAYKRTLEEAKLANALTAESLKNERNKLDLEHAQRMREFEKDREASKAKLLSREEELTVLEAELKKQALIQKEQAEKESTYRKAVLEVVKYGPAVAVGLAALWKTIEKIREKK